MNARSLAVIIIILTSASPALPQAPGPRPPAEGEGQGAGAPAAGSPEAAAPGMPENLDGLLAIALRTNPEIQKAQARLSRAQADLNQARLKATRDVISAYHERRKLKEMADVQTSQRQRMKQLQANGQASADSVEASILAFTETSSRLAQLEARIRYMLGIESGPRPRGEKDESGRQWLAAGPSAPPGAPPPPETAGGPESPPPPRRLEIPEKMKTFLEKRVSLRIEGGSGTLRTVCDWLRESFSGQTFVVDVSALGQLDEGAEVTLELKDTALRDALLAIADLFKVCFVFRDYGVLMVYPVDVARDYHSPTIPPEAALEPRGR